jgi:hypothetical protein
MPDGQGTADMFCCLLHSTEGLEFILVASTFFGNTEADEVVVVMGLETGRVFIVHKLICHLNLEAGDREQHRRVSGDITGDSNPVEWSV